MYETITKTIVAWLFNKYIAYYFFDNININQLKCAFNEGQVELKDLPIKPDALRHLCIPWNVTSGTVGKLVIQIPLLSLLTSPWDITLSDLNLVVSPSRSQLKMIKETTQPSSISDYLDEPMLDESSEGTKLAEFYKSFSCTVSSMVKDVFRNLRLEITSIQIIFEDNKTKFEADKLTLTRPDSEKRLVMKNLSIFGRNPKPDGVRIDSCDLKIRDVAPHSYEFISDYDILGQLYIEGTKPRAKFLLEDFRLLFYTCDQQQDGSIFARISCSHFDKEKSSWEGFLEPWPFNLSWDKRQDLRRFSLTSDELAEISMNSALLDLIDVIIKHITADTSKSWPSVVRSKQRFPNHESPQNFKITYYNYNTNLAQQIGARSARQLFTQPACNSSFDMTFVGPGIKVILLDNIDEKFVMITLENVVIESTTKAKEQIIDCSIQNLRIENMMPDCEKTIVLDRASPNDGKEKPAFTLIIDRILGRSFGTVWFKQVQVSMCELFLNIEEKLFLKFVEFVSFRLRKPKRDTSRDTDRIIQPESRQSKYYFDLLRIDLSSLELSVFMAKSLPETLQRLKTLSGLKFYGFEDARVELAPYFKMNVTRTWGGILESVTRFYKRQMSEQAPRIVVQQIQNYMLFHLSDILSSLYDEVYNQLF